MRGTRTRGRVLGMACVLVLLALAVTAPVIASQAAVEAGDPPATLRAVVRYLSKDPGTGAREVNPLVGVEVYLVDDPERFACTNANGVAIFRDLAPGSVRASSGVSFTWMSPRCANADFLHPTTGDKMYGVWWNRHYGVGILDEIVLSAGETRVILMVARTPKNQRMVCGGFAVNRPLGTPGDDIITGTAARDVINALGGDDIVNGGDGSDVICGGPGADLLRGQGGGDDRLFGESGPDTLVSGPGPVGGNLWGGPGFDVCSLGIPDGMMFDCEIENVG